MLFPPLLGINLNVPLLNSWTHCSAPSAALRHSGCQHYPDCPVTSVCFLKSEIFRAGECICIYLYNVSSVVLTVQYRLAE